jgi:endonuclease YncB( thermonuclease family)
MFGEELRLKGIDAPELGQLCHREGRPWRCGLAAKAALEREIRGVVSCVGRGRDRYGRALVTCRAGGADIAAALARGGMALAYGGYEREEAEARDARRGVWASSFERPEDWRRAHPRGGGP